MLIKELPPMPQPRLFQLEVSEEELKELRIFANIYAAHGNVPSVRYKAKILSEKITDLLETD